MCTYPPVLGMICSQSGKCSWYSVSILQRNKNEKLFLDCGENKPQELSPKVFCGSTGISDLWALGKPVFGFCSLFCCQYEGVFLQSTW